MWVVERAGVRVPELPFLVPGHIEDPIIHSQSVPDCLLGVFVCDLHTEGVHRLQPCPCKDHLVGGVTPFQHIRPLPPCLVQTTLPYAHIVRRPPDLPRLGLAAGTQPAARSLARAAAEAVMLILLIYALLVLPFQLEVELVTYRLQANHRGTPYLRYRKPGLRII